MDVHMEKLMLDGLVSTNSQYSTVKKSAVACTINILSSSSDDHHE
jgi:hypothetical protein